MCPDEAKCGGRLFLSRNRYPPGLLSSRTPTHHGVALFSARESAWQMAGESPGVSSGG